MIKEWEFYGNQICTFLVSSFNLGVYYQKKKKKNFLLQVTILCNKINVSSVEKVIQNIH